MALILDSLRHAFGAQRVLQGIAMRIEPGCVTGLFGRNGSGKTTILEIATGQRKADAGSVFIDEEPQEGRSRRHRFARIAYLPQRGMLPRELPVEVILRSVPGGVALRQDDLLRPLRWRRIGRLSTGERRYLEIALVTGLPRRYFLLDEPLAGLEPMIAEQVLLRIRALAERGAGVLVSDQRVDDLSPVVQRCYVLAHGRCREYNPEEIRDGLVRSPWE